MLCGPNAPWPKCSLAQMCVWPKWVWPKCEFGPIECGPIESLAQLSVAQLRVWPNCLRPNCLWPNGSWPNCLGPNCEFGQIVSQPFINGPLREYPFPTYFTHEFAIQGKVNNILNVSMKRKLP